ncbi:MAG: hypothetical protein ABSG43_10500 [Solirubrobacteraceae bacterium]
MASGALAVLIAVVTLSPAIAAPASTVPSACLQNAPCNDDYIDSLELNARGTRLNRTDTLSDVRNTTTATVQSNLFNPCGNATCPSGPAETTTCDGVSYGKTVWYDFYPDANGTILIQTSGFDNMIALYTFNTSTLVPTELQCAHTSDFPSEQLSAQVTKGTAYTFQVGGVDDAGGLLQMLFDFYATPPRRLTAQTTLTARATANGIKLLSLSVATARAAHVQVSCSGFCRPLSKSGNAVEMFSALAGVSMPGGSKLQIRVTAPHSIGAFIQYNILPGNFTKITRCTEPGQRKPRLTCH